MKIKQPIKKEKSPPKPSFRADGYINLINKYGTKYDSNQSYSFQSEPTVPDIELAKNYEGNGLFAKIIDRPAEEAVKHGLVFGINDADITDYLEDKLDALDWEGNAMTAIKWARLFGGAIMVMLIDDGCGLEDPVDWDNIRSIDELRVFERPIVQPDWSSVYGYSDSITTAFSTGEAEYYQVSSVYGSFVVHKDRCLIFRNGVLPEFYTQAQYRMWGMPEYVRIKRDLTNTVTTHGNGSKLLEKSVQAIYKMQGLASLLATQDGEEQVLKRLQIIDMARGILNSIAIDSQGEEYDFKTFQLSGVKDIIDSTCNMLSAVTNIPQTVLFGRSPAGENSTGTGDMENYYNFIEGIQKLMLKNNVRIITKIIMKAGISQGKVASEIELKPTFKPLWNLSEVEQASINQAKATTALTKAQTTQAYVDMQALDPSEVRAALAKSEEYVVEDILDRIGDEEGWEVPPDISQPQQENPEPQEEAPTSENPEIDTMDGGPGSGNFGHSGRPGELGGSGDGGGPGSEAAKSPKFKNKSEATQKKYDKARESEKAITKEMMDVAAELGTSMEGLQYSVKTAESLERKIDKKVKEKGCSEEQAIDSMGDIVRYTNVSTHNETAKNAEKTLHKLEEKGYNVVELENSWLNPNRAYKGINVNLLSPDGQKFELQFHSKESLEVKNKIHPLYEKQRLLPDDSDEYHSLESEMMKISSTMPPPKRIESLKDIKKRRDSYGLDVCDFNRGSSR